MSEHFRAYVSVHVILQRADEILFHLRENTGFMDDHWALVSGHIEGGESARAAAVREALEEAGIVIQPADLELVHVTHSLNRREYIAFWMRCRTWTGEICNREPHRCGGLAFYPRDDLPTPIIPFVKSTLDVIDEGKIYSEIGF